MEADPMGKVERSVKTPTIGVVLAGVDSCPDPTEMAKMQFGIRPLIT
jgi:hypothetical protein